MCLVRITLSWDLRRTYAADCHFIGSPHTPIKGPICAIGMGPTNQPLSASSHHSHQMTIWWATLKRPEPLSGPSISFLRAPIKARVCLIVATFDPVGSMRIGIWSVGPPKLKMPEDICSYMLWVRYYSRISLQRITPKNLGPRVDRIDNWGPVHVSPHTWNCMGGPPEQCRANCTVTRVIYGHLTIRGCPGLPSCCTVALATCYMRMDVRLPINLHCPFDVTETNYLNR